MIEHLEGSETTSLYREEWKEARFLDTDANPNALALAWRWLRDTLQRLYNLVTQSQVARILTQRMWAGPGRTQTTSESPISTNTPTSRTVSLDALRGLACLVVFNFHFLYPYTITAITGYGIRDDLTHVHQLPILCLLVRGRAMVTLFFAISGYVLSSGFLASTRSNEVSKGVSRLSSLALRRWMRLFAPATISMSLAAVGAAMGAFEAGRAFQSSPLKTGAWEQHPPQKDNFEEQLWHFCHMWWEWTTPWLVRKYYSDYDPHTWTIPIEFRGSMVLFLLLLASAGLRHRWRTGLFIAIAVYSFSTERWEYGTFLGGAVVADLHQAWPANRKPNILLGDDSPARHVLLSRRCVMPILDWLVIVFGLFILSYPDNKAELTPGFVWLFDLTPPVMLLHGEAHFFWFSMGSFLVLWSVERIAFIQWFLSGWLPQYFGRISFSLYLVHGPLLHSLGFAIQPKIWEFTGRATVAQWCGGLLVGWAIMLSLSTMAGHLFNKAVDVPLVKATRYLERIACKKR